MRTKELRIFVYEYPTLYDLPEADQKLVLAAREASSGHLLLIPGLM
jgi:cytidine deaminase